MNEISEEYHHAVERMDEIKEHTRLLLNRLHQADALEIKGKDKIRNQALLDMQEQLRAVVQDFLSK
jgi:hypothetical protein